MLESLIARLIIGFVGLLTGARTYWRTRPNAAQRIYFANHASHGDFVLVWAALPASLRRRARPVAGADYWNKSALRRYIGGKVFRAVLIERERREGGPDPIQVMREALAGGDSLILFPEGTRNTTEAPLLPFKSGLFHLASQYTHAELVPVWINNLARVMPKGALLPIPLLCTVHVGAPLRLAPGEDKAAFLARMRDALLALRPANPDEDEPVQTPQTPSGHDASVAAPAPEKTA